MKKTLLNNVQAQRKGMGETQQELADAVGVTRQTIIAIEKGNYTPSVALAIAIATHVGETVESLFYYDK